MLLLLLHTCFVDGIVVDDVAAADIFIDVLASKNDVVSTVSQCVAVVVVDLVHADSSFVDFDVSDAAFNAFEIDAVAAPVVVYAEIESFYRLSRLPFEALMCFLNFAKTSTAATKNFFPRLLPRS